MPLDDPKDIDRFAKDIDRFSKDIDRLLKEIDRGPKDIDRASGAIVEDVFRQVTGLNGFLVVSFVAPVAGSQSLNGRRAAKNPMMATVARKAEAREQEDAVQNPVDPDTLRQLLKTLPEFLKYLEQKAKPKA